jgi:hypothetical protein
LNRRGITASSPVAATAIATITAIGTDSEKGECVKKEKEKFEDLPADGDSRCAADGRGGRAADNPGKLLIFYLGR